MENNKIIIRKSFLEEAKECYKLIEKLAIYEGENTGSIITEKEFLDFNSSNPPLLQCLIAKKGSTMAGMIVYYYRYSTWKGKHIHLEDLYVEEEYRKEGIGKLLLSELISLAKRENYKRIEWELSSTNEKAEKFYKKMGAEVIDNWKICRLELN